MFDQEPDQIIAKSQRALAEWTWLATIDDHLDDLLEVLNREVRKLASIAFEHPDKAKTILDLIDGYKDLAAHVESDWQAQWMRRMSRGVESVPNPDAQQVQL